jgi:hypothetical protein
VTQYYWNFENQKWTDAGITWCQKVRDCSNADPARSCTTVHKSFNGDLMAYDYFGFCECEEPPKLCGTDKVTMHVTEVIDLDSGKVVADNLVYEIGKVYFDESIDDILDDFSSEEEDTTSETVEILRAWFWGEEG